MLAWSVCKRGGRVVALRLTAASPIRQHMPLQIIRMEACASERQDYSVQAGALGLPQFDCGRTWPLRTFHSDSNASSVFLQTSFASASVQQPPASAVQSGLVWRQSMHSSAISDTTQYYGQARPSSQGSRTQTAAESATPNRPRSVVQRRSSISSTRQEANERAVQPQKRHKHDDFEWDVRPNPDSRPAPAQHRVPPGQRQQQQQPERGTPSQGNMQTPYNRPAAVRPRPELSNRGRPPGKFPQNSDVRVVFEDGSHEIMPYVKAVRKAEQTGLDLMDVAPNARPPVFRLGSAKEAAQKDRLRQKEQRKKDLDNRKKQVAKEIRVGPTTAEHDLQLKLRQARGFLDKNYRVKVSISFRNPEQQKAAEMLERLRSLCAEFASVRNPAANEKLMRNTYALFLSPASE